uniref:Uncharacterized protein n=1 Tax=Romanomermis culicivorax TaxID=13658 RepID=A0A915I1M5_ROMCU
MYKDRSESICTKKFFLYAENYDIDDDDDDFIRNSTNKFIEYGIIMQYIGEYAVHGLKTENFPSASRRDGGVRKHQKFSGALRRIL